MELNDRRLSILRAIISSYIQEGEAVGSRTISKKYNLGISSATVRNEMADLEELGFLIQPHTSAGRIPTDKAYRLHVDDILKNKRNNKYNDQIKRILNEEVNEMENYIKNSSRILSQLTKYTSFALAPQLRESAIKHIQLVPVSEYKILMVMVTGNNVVKNVIFNLNTPIPTNQLNRISNLLTEKLAGTKLSQLDKKLQEKILGEIFLIRESFDSKLDELLLVLMNTINQYEKVDIYYDGLTNILNYPEYSDMNKARELLSFVEEKNSLAQILMNSQGEDLNILIGHENQFEQIKECSIISATYRLNGIIIGKVGLIGPTRMDYNNVISMVKALSFNINKLVKENYMEISRSDVDEER